MIFHWITLLRKARIAHDQALKQTAEQAPELKLCQLAYRN